MRFFGLGNFTSTSNELSANWFTELKLTQINKLIRFRNQTPYSFACHSDGIDVETIRWMHAFPTIFNVI